MTRSFVPLSDFNIEDVLNHHASLDEGCDPHSWDARYKSPGLLKDLLINSLPDSSGVFPQSVRSELSDIFTGGNPDGDLPNLPATDWATCLVKPRTEEETNFVAPTHPWVEFKGQSNRLVPVDIRTIMGNSAISPPLFEPVMTNGYGFLIWKYIGEEPLHVLMDGSLEYMIRISATTQAARARHILSLQAFDPPYMEVGENRGTRFLSSSNEALDYQGERFTNYLWQNDACAPLSEAVLDDMLDDPVNRPNLYVGSDPGFIGNSVSPSWVFDEDTQLYLSDQNGPVGPEVMTTKWIDVSAIDKLTSCFAMTFDGYSSRSRIQYKDADGEIRYFAGQSTDTPSHRVFRLPTDAMEFRVYYAGKSDTCGDNQVDIRQLSPAVSNEVDPLKGYFVRRLFNVKRDVVFWPGVSYALAIYTEVRDLGNARSWGFRPISGGLSFNFDVGRIRKKLAQKLYVR